MKRLTCCLAGFVFLLLMQNAYASGAGGLAGRTNVPEGGNSNLTLYLVGAMTVVVIVRIILFLRQRP
jgi:hypothetical protein